MINAKNKVPDFKEHPKWWDQPHFKCLIATGSSWQSYGAEQAQNHWLGNCSISVKPKQAQIAALTHLHVLKTQNHRVGKRCVPFGSNSSTHYLGVQENSIFLIHLVKKSCIYDVSKRRVWNKGNCTGTWGNRRTKCHHHSFHTFSCPTTVMLLWLTHMCSGVPRKFTLSPWIQLILMTQLSASLWFRKSSPTP